MGPNTKLHDGIIGILLVVGAFLTFYVHTYFLFLAGILGAVMLQSAFTGFCPIYYALGKLRKN